MYIYSRIMKEKSYELAPIWIQFNFLSEFLVGKFQKLFTDGELIVIIIIISPGLGLMFYFVLFRNIVRHIANKITFTAAVNKEFFVQTLFWKNLTK